MSDSKGKKFLLAAQNSTMPASVEGFHVAATVPPQGPEGYQIHSSIDQEPRAHVGAVFTNGCEVVVRVAEWLDYMYSEEGGLLVNMGIEGETYTMVDGEPVFTDYVMNNPDGLSPKEAVGSYSFAQSSGPFVLSSAQTSQLDDASVLEAKEEYIIPFLEESKKYVLPGSLSFTSEQDSVRRAAMADIEIYVDEMVMKFITGREPLSNWDTYVNTVKQMGIDNVLSIYQEVVDAWNS